MRLLDEITGQRSVIAQALGRQPYSCKECLIVSGPGGSGVSWTLNKIGVQWEDGGGVALKATGAAVTPPRPLLPWLTMASPSRNTLARWEVLKQGAAEASKAIPILGEAASYLVGEALHYRRKRLARQAQVLGEKEQDIMFVVENAARGKRLLLLIDQLSDWDEESWGLLELVVSSILHDLYPSLKSAFIVLGVSESILHRSRALLEKLPSTECELKRLQREDLALALKTLAFPQLVDHEMDLLYEATGGRLDLLHDFAALENDLGATNFHGDRSALYGRMIERRLRAIKGDLRALEGLLSAASFLGGTFSPEEASCLTGYALEDIQAILRQAEEEKLLAARGGYITFPSITMRHYFLSSRVANPSYYHGKFAECLRRLRPGDYEARSQHLLLAGQTDSALVCHCLASLDARRRRRVLADPAQLRGVAGWQEYGHYLELMHAAYSAHDRDELQEGISILESIEAILPDPLIAERDYLDAQIRMKSHRTVDIERVVGLLRPWEKMKDVEPEVWSRTAQTLMVALSETDYFQDACRIEEALTRYYGSRRTLDPWALFGLNCLRRQAESLHHLIPARNRLESALAYFGPTAAGTLPRHPLQYYYTLTNLVANLLANASFAEARVRGAELELLVKNHPTFDWPSLEIAANNSILAGYLAGVLPLQEATNLMQQIDDGRIEIGDRLLIQNNLAVLLVHGGDLEEAKRILSGAWGWFGGKADSDVYHRYFVANNLAGLVAVEGDPDRALKMLEETGKDLKNLYPAIRETLLRRHTMMAEALRAASGLGAKKFDCFLKDHYAPQVGPQWEFYGRGFLFSDIQFWTSD